MKAKTAQEFIGEILHILEGGAFLDEMCATVIKAARSRFKPPRIANRSSYLRLPIPLPIAVCLLTTLRPCGMVPADLPP